MLRDGGSTRVGPTKKFSYINPLKPESHSGSLELVSSGLSLSGIFRQESQKYVSWRTLCSFVVWPSRVVDEGECLDLTDRNRVHRGVRHPLRKDSQEREYQGRQGWKLSLRFDSLILRREHSFPQPLMFYYIDRWRDRLFSLCVQIKNTRRRKLSVKKFFSLLLLYSSFFVPGWSEDLSSETQLIPLHTLVYLISSVLKSFPSLHLPRSPLMTQILPFLQLWSFYPSVTFPPNPLSLCHTQTANLSFFFIFFLSLFFSSKELQTCI